MITRTTLRSVIHSSTSQSLYSQRARNFSKFQSLYRERGNLFFESHGLYIEEERYMMTRTSLRLGLCSSKSNSLYIEGEVRIFPSPRDYIRGKFHGLHTGGRAINDDSNLALFGDSLFLVPKTICRRRARNFSKSRDPYVEE